MADADARGAGSGGNSPERPWFDEFDLLVRLAADLRPGLLVDVGAHIGRLSMRFAEAGWRVIAVEASPEIFSELEENLAPYPDARPVHAAAGDVDGTTTFYLSDAYWGIHSLRPFDESHTKTVTVDAVRLDTLLGDEELPEPTFLKVDTEGADLLVLRGWDFARSRPKLVMCEFMDARTEPHFGYRTRDLVDFMGRWGYAAYVSEWSPVVEYARRGVASTVSVHLGVFSSDLHHDPSWGNLVFVAEEDRGWFEEGLVDYLTDLHQSAWELLADADRLRRRNERMEQTIANRERRIAQLDRAVAARDGRIAQLDRAVAARDDRIAQLDRAVAARDDRIAQLDRAVAARDDRIAELEAELAAMEARRWKTRLRRYAGRLRRRLGSR